MVDKVIPDDTTPPESEFEKWRKNYETTSTQTITELKTQLTELQELLKSEKGNNSAIKAEIAEVKASILQASSAPAGGDTKPTAPAKNAQPNEPPASPPTPANDPPQAVPRSKHDWI